jgi:Uma2 family endonuclease
VGNAVRYPDALVTCSKFEADSRLTLEPVVVFEVLSPSSGRIDRIIKVQEYLAVASIRRYVIVESAFSGVTTLEQQDGRWLSAALGSEDVLQLPELGLAIPVSEFYEDITFPAPAGPP